MSGCQRGCQGRPLGNAILLITQCHAPSSNRCGLAGRKTDTWRVNCDARLGLGDAFASLLCCEWLCVSEAHASFVMAKTRAAKQMCLHGKLDGALPLNPAPLQKLWILFLLEDSITRGQLLRV